MGGHDKRVDSVDDAEDSVPLLDHERGDDIYNRISIESESLGLWRTVEEIERGQEELGIGLRQQISEIKKEIESLKRSKLAMLQDVMTVAALLISTVSLLLAAIMLLLRVLAHG
ncbi:MAG: hypothetical protein GXO32_00595 [Crenarchaeota archaeon]|nr:hypothetical protein [Thermoproteota archaeon]